MLKKNNCPPTFGLRRRPAGQCERAYFSAVSITAAGPHAGHQARLDSACQCKYPISTTTFPPLQHFPI